jgi:hypothetical protein
MIFRTYHEHTLPVPPRRRRTLRFLRFFRAPLPLLVEDHSEDHSGDACSDHHCGSCDGGASTIEGALAPAAMFAGSELEPLRRALSPRVDGHVTQTSIASGSQQMEFEPNLRCPSPRRACR